MMTLSAGKSPTIPKMYPQFLYVCGAISSPNEEQVKRNLEDGVRQANYFREAGVPVFSPHAHTLGLREKGNKFTGQEGYHMALMNDFAILQFASAMYVMTGWEKSTGCRAEVLYCDQHNIPVLESFDEVIAHFDKDHVLMNVYQMSEGAYDDR
jgi:hypothetical protein